MRRSSKALWLAVLAALLLSLSVFLHRNSGKPLVPESPAPHREVTPEGTGKTESGQPPLSLAPRIPKLDPNQAEERWKDFRHKFGEKLEGAFTSDHRLSRVRGSRQTSTPLPGFSGGDRKSALARGEEILSSAKDLIGLNSRFPLQAKVVATDEISSQIEWVQTYQNIPIEPYGRLTVQLDSHGGLRGLYSTYISDPSITNQPTLDETSAKKLAISGIHFTPDQPNGLESRVGKGELILFAPGPQDSERSVELSYAYRYWIDGREVIIDASNGRILSEKDRRQY